MTTASRAVTFRTATRRARGVCPTRAAGDAARSQTGRVRWTARARPVAIQIIAPGEAVAIDVLAGLARLEGRLAGPPEDRGHEAVLGLPGQKHAAIDRIVD